MSQLKATNNFVFIIREKAESEKSNIYIPPEGRVKSHWGTIFSIGNLVKDQNIKGSKNKKAFFHKGVGQPIDFEGVEYLVMQDIDIIAVL